MVYLGTHDNNTTRGWLEEDLDETARQHLARYVTLGDSEATVHAMLELLLSSRARIAIVCAQDLLCLGSAARMNTPGIATGNWRWQLTADQMAALPLRELESMCERHGRVSH